MKDRKIIINKNRHRWSSYSIMHVYIARNNPLNIKLSLIGCLPVMRIDSYQKQTKNVLDGYGVHPKTPRGLMHVYKWELYLGIEADNKCRFH